MWPRSQSEALVTSMFSGENQGTPRTHTVLLPDDPGHGAPGHRVRPWSPVCSVGRITLQQPTLSCYLITQVMVPQVTEWGLGHQYVQWGESHYNNPHCPATWSPRSWCPRSQSEALVTSMFSGENQGTPRTHTVLLPDHPGHGAPGHRVRPWSPVCSVGRIKVHQEPTLSCCLITQVMAPQVTEWGLGHQYVQWGESRYTKNPHCPAAWSPRSWRPRSQSEALVTSMFSGENQGTPRTHTVLLPDHPGHGAPGHRVRPWSPVCLTASSAHKSLKNNRNDAPTIMLTPLSATLNKKLHPPRKGDKQTSTVIQYSRSII